MARYGQPVMLMTTEWHPSWISYEWWSDIGTGLLGALASLFVGGASVVVAFAALRIARRGHQLAKQAERRETRAAEFDARERAASELVDLIRVRRWKLQGPSPYPGEALMHANDRDESDILIAATTRAASLREQDRYAFNWLVNLVKDYLEPKKTQNLDILSAWVHLSIRQWVVEPEVFQQRMSTDHPDLAPHG